MNQISYFLKFPKFTLIEIQLIQVWGRNHFGSYVNLKEAITKP